MQDHQRDQKLVDRIGEELEAASAKVGKLTRQQRTLQEDLKVCEARLSDAKEDVAEIDGRFKAALRGETGDVNAVPVPDEAGADADGESAVDDPDGMQAVDAAASQTADKPQLGGHRPDARETRSGIFDPETPAEDARGDVTGL